MSQTPGRDREPLVAPPPVITGTPPATRPAEARSVWRGAWESLTVRLSRRLSTNPENIRWAVGGFAAGIAACLLVMIGVSAMRAVFRHLPLPVVGDQRTLGDFVQHAKRYRVDYPFVYTEDETAVFTTYPPFGPGEGDSLGHGLYDIRVQRFASSAAAIESCKRHDGMTRNGIWVMYVGPRASLSDELRRAFEGW